MSYDRVPLEQFQEEVSGYRECQLILDDAILPLRFNMEVDDVVFSPYVSRTMTLRAKNTVVSLDFVKNIKKKRLTNGMVSYQIYCENGISNPYYISCAVELVCIV